MNELFASPIASAKESRNTGSDYTYQDFIRILVQCSFASAAAYMVLNPSIQYAESKNEFDQVSFPVCTITAALFLNLFYIRSLFDEIRTSYEHRGRILISIGVGMLAALPILYTELDIGEHIGIAAMVYIGTLPAQVLGSWYLLNKCIPLMKYFLSQRCDTEGYAPYAQWQQRQKRQFLDALEVSIPVVLENHNSLTTLSLDPGALLECLFSKEKPTAFIVSNERINQLSGCLGILLALGLTPAFIKASFDRMFLSMPLTPAILCAGLIVLPMLVLTCVNGYCMGRDGAKFFQKATSRKHLLPYQRYPLPFGFSKKVGALYFSVFLLMAVRSYAALVEFNRKTLKEDVSEDVLKSLDIWTMIAAVWYNGTAMLSVANVLYGQLLQRFSVPAISHKVLCLNYLNKVLRSYQTLLRENYFDELSDYVGDEERPPSPVRTVSTASSSSSGSAIDDSALLVSQGPGT